MRDRFNILASFYTDALISPALCRGSAAASTRDQSNLWMSKDELLVEGTCALAAATKIVILPLKQPPLKKKKKQERKKLGRVSMVAFHFFIPVPLADRPEVSRGLGQALVLTAAPGRAELGALLGLGASALAVAAPALRKGAPGLAISATQWAPGHRLACREGQNIRTEN